MSDEGRCSERLTFLARSDRELDDPAARVEGKGEDSTPTTRPKPSSHEFGTEVGPGEPG